MVILDPAVSAAPFLGTPGVGLEQPEVAAARAVGIGPAGNDKAAVSRLPDESAPVPAAATEGAAPQLAPVTIGPDEPYIVIAGHRRQYGTNDNVAAVGGFLEEFASLVPARGDPEGSRPLLRAYGVHLHQPGIPVTLTERGSHADSDVAAVTGLLCVIALVKTGATSSNSVGNDDLWLIKTDANGTAQWMLTFGGRGYEEGHFVRTTSDGGYIVVGSTTSTGAGESDVWLIKLDINGRMAWSRTFGGAEWDWGDAVHETTGGGYILVGTTLSFGAGGSDVWLIKTDADGNEEWSRTYGGHSLDFGLSVQPTTDGGYIIAGQTYSFGAGNGDLWLIKTDSEGQAVF
ncbi:hypothetical protein ES703_73554 [subsurface metagenome]